MWCWFQFDQTEIDEALEDKRRNEILHGASDLTEVKDEDLFVIDRGNKKKEPKKGKTKILRQKFILCFSYDKNAKIAGEQV